MQQKNYRNFHFGNIYSDCFVAVKKQQQQQQQSARNVATRRQAQAQTQTQEYNLKQKQGQVQVAVTVGEVNSSYEQQTSSLRHTRHSSTSVTTTTRTLNDESARIALTKSIDCSNSTTLSNNSVAATTPTTTPFARKTDTDTVAVTNAKYRRNNTPLKPMPLLTHLLRMSLSLANAAQLLRQV